jgi:hypothetical protein
VTSQPDAKTTHECVFPELATPGGRKSLGQCMVCGMTAADAMAKLRGDVLRKLVVDFLAERPNFLRAMDSCPPDNQADYHRWTGNSEARRMLLARLDKAGVDLAFAPTLQELNPTPATPRNAAAVRALHVLETLTVGETQYSACKADGHMSDDLAADPCPTLAALNKTDPQPVPVEPLLDLAVVVDAVYKALNSALANGGNGIEDWSLLGEAEKAADKIVGTIPTIDLSSEAAHKRIAQVLTSPGLTTPRAAGEAVPNHQTRAILESLRKATQ